MADSKQSNDLSDSTYRDFSRVMPDKHANDASSLLQQSTTAKEPTFPVKVSYGSLDTA